MLPDRAAFLPYGCEALQRIRIRYLAPLLRHAAKAGKSIQPSNLKAAVCISEVQVMPATSTEHQQNAGARERDQQDVLEAAQQEVPEAEKPDSRIAFWGSVVPATTMKDVPISTRP